MDEIWPQERDDFEVDPQFTDFAPGNFMSGPEWTQVDPAQPLELGNPVLANEEPADEFPEESGEDVTGLLYLGYLTKTFDLYGHSFTIRTLRRGEKMDALSLAQEYENTLGQAAAVETALVAAAVELVDGHPLTLPLSKSDKAIVRIRANYAKVSDWFDPMVEGVYDEYSALVRRQVIAFEALQGKSKAGRLTP